MSLYFKSLLTALIIKNSLILAGIYVFVLKICSRPNLKSFQYQIYRILSNCIAAG